MFVERLVSGHDLTFNLEFQRDEESGWFAVHIVELPGCASQGATLEEAKANIANALESYMDVLLETAIRNQSAPDEPVSLPEARPEALVLA